jgi:hypothetical protein
VLYSDKASRPNTPVNVLIGALILKEFSNLTDDELVESLMFDIRFQYALHTTSFAEQPLSDRSLGRFRERNTAYEAETGIDLIKNCILSLTSEIAELMKIDGSLKRMDSFMVASNIKKMSRLELLYTSVCNLVKLVEKRGSDTVPKRLKHYLDEDDRNKMIYHRRSEEADSRIEEVLQDAKRLLKTCKNNYDQDSEYLLLLRVLNEQANLDDDGNYILKKAGDPGITADSVQNPADPDASFRSKGGKAHTGYVANVVESSSEEHSLITDWQYERNTYSDSQFIQDYLHRKDDVSQEEVLVTDGAYGSVANQELAEKKNVKLVTTDLVGRKPNEIEADFIFNDDGTEVLQCPAGHTPKSCNYIEQHNTCRISFHREQCESCQYREQCRPTIKTLTSCRQISLKGKLRAKTLQSMKTEEHRALARHRNGVESLPSIYRRRYNVDRMPVRGYHLSKLGFNFKTAAVNVKKFISYFFTGDTCAQNPVKAANMA